MKQISLRLLAIASVLIMSTTRCSGPASMLGSGSPLLSALGSNSSLSTMSGILQTPGLSNLLGSSLKGPFTLLAPSNDAFAALGSSAVSDLAKPENLNMLAGVLKNHIVPGKLDASSLMGAGVKTAAGSPLSLGGANLGSVVGGKNFNIIPVDKVLK